MPCEGINEWVPNEGVPVPQPRRCEFLKGKDNGFLLFVPSGSTWKAAWLPEILSLKRHDHPSVRQKHSPLLGLWKELGQGDAAEGSVGEAVGLGQLPARGQTWLPLHTRLSRPGQPQARPVSCGHFQSCREKPQ